jgi:hypothetical protein
VPLDPTAHDGGEFADLEIKSLVGPRFPAQQIFVKARIEVLLARIESSIQSDLDETIDVGAKTGVQKQTEARVEEAPVFEQQARRALVHVVALQVQQA